MKKEIEEVFENGNPVNLYSSYDDDEFLFKYKKEFDYLERDSIFTEYFIRNNEVDTVVTNYLYAEQPSLLLLTVLAGQPKFKSIAEAPSDAAIAALSAKVSGLLPNS